MQAIRCENVSIRYITGDFKDIGLKEYVMRRLKGRYKVREFWADRGVSFALEKGDMLGIIGANGAGKSTLLKAVSGIMVPTEGSMEINGSVAALLELGSGFDPDLTVQENTFLRGAMLGYTRAFMEEKYDEIIAFAELEDFQDRPFKQLSSGMRSRLAFSIACLVHPDILILDEVLSVGDGAFKKKSGDKMKEILSSGVTGILVSHSVEQVRSLCNKILWLDHGKQILFTDEVDAACDAYEEFLDTHKMPKTVSRIKQLPLPKARPAPPPKVRGPLETDDRPAKELVLGDTKGLRIRQKDLAAAAYLYMLLPIGAFLLTWLRLWIGIPAVAILGYGFYRLLKSDPYAGKTIYFDRRCLLLVFALICLWCWLAGQGGWFYQMWDNHYRNALFRDMITHDWPVYYQADGSALVYYLMQWVLPALVGKLFGWTAANIALFVWDALGIFLAVLAVLFYLKVADSKKCLLILAVFVCWGGLNLIASGIAMQITGDGHNLLIAGDGWTDLLEVYGYQYSANITLLQWVYNQAIVPWIAVPLLLLAPQVEVFAFLGLCVLPYAPLPFTGLVLLMLSVAGWQFAVSRREKKLKEFAKKVFSAPNLAAMATLLPVFAAYFTCNSGATGAEGIGGFGLFVPLSAFGPYRLCVYAMFLLFSFGIYALLILPKYRRSLFFRAAVVSLVFIPLFRVGTSSDFCMRASIPAFMVIMIYVMRYLLEEWKMAPRTLALIVCLAFSAWDLFGGVGESVQQSVRAGTVLLPADEVGSLENYPLGLMEEKLDRLPDYNFNYCCFDPQEQFFYKYLADPKHFS